MEFQFAVFHRQTLDETFKNHINHWDQEINTIVSYCHFYCYYVCY